MPPFAILLMDLQIDFLDTGKGRMNHAYAVLVWHVQKDLPRT